MVSTETLQVILDAKDQLSSKVRQAENTIKSMGTTANVTSTTATSATTRIGTAYDTLRAKVTNVWNSIKNTIRNSSIGQTISSSGLAQPFLNAAETIRSKWQGLMQTIRSSKAKPSIDTSGVNTAEKKINELRQKINQVNSLKASPRFEMTQLQQADGKIKVVVKDLENLKNKSTITLKVNSNGSELNNVSNMVDKVIQRTQKLNSTTVTPKVSPAGLATLNGEITKTAQLTVQLSSRFGTLGQKIGIAFSGAVSKIEAFKSKLNTVGQRMQSIVGGLSGVQSAIMGAFGAIGVTSLSQFTIGAAIAREKVNAVTKSVTGAGQAFETVNRKIKSSVAGTTLGYNNMATAVNNVALRFHVTGEAVGNLAGPMAKIGVLAQAMGKSSSEAASVMEHAYDGLLGKWRALKTYGITEEDLRAAGWSGAADDVDGYTRALDRVLERNPKLKEFTSTFEYQFESLKMSIQAVGTEIGLMLLPILKSIVEFFLDLNKEAPWLTKALVLLAIAVVALVSALAVLAPIIIMIVELQELQAFTALAANWPYLLLAAAILIIVGVLLYYYNTNETVRQAMDRTAETIKSSLVKAWDILNRIVQPLIPTFNHFLAVLGRLGNDLLGVFGITGEAADNFDWLGLAIDAVSFVIQDIIFRITFLVEILSAVLIPVINLIINIVSIVINLIVSVAEAFSLLMEGDIVGFLTTLGEALWTFFSQLLTVIGQFFIELLNNLNLMFNNMIYSTWNWLVQWISSMINGAWQAVTGFLVWIATLPVQLLVYLVQAWLNFCSWRDNLVNKAKEAAMTAVNNFIEYIKTLPGKFKEWLDNTINKIKDFARTLYERMKSAAQDAVNGFKDKISNLPQEMWNVLVSIKNKIVSGVGMLVDAMRNLAWSMWNSFVSIFTGNTYAFSPLEEAITRISQNVSSSAGTFYDAGLLLGEAVSAGFENGETIPVISSQANNSNKLSYELTHSIQNKNNNILETIVDLLRELLDQGEEEQTVHAELEQSGTVTIQHDINLENVPDGIDENELVALIKQLLNSDDVIKALTTNREFQRMDTRMKQKIIREYERHV